LPGGAFKIIAERHVIFEGLGVGCRQLIIAHEPLLRASGSSTTAPSRTPAMASVGSKGIRSGSGK